MSAPPLDPGETLLCDHIPSLRAFRRTALLGIALSIPPMLAFLVILPDTVWPVVPLFLTCLLLMQERFRLGRHRAWVTSRRVIFQGGRSLPLPGLTEVRAAHGAVYLSGAQGAEKLSYAARPAELAAVINTARASE